MALHKIIEADNGTKVGIWEVTESLADLEASVQLSENEKCQYSTFRFDGRKKEWLAVRALLCHMMGHQSPINYLDTGRPTTQGCHISISHTRNYVSVSIANKPTAVDIEFISDRANKVWQRFVSDSEMHYIDFENPTLPLLVIWSAKEVLYKLYDRQGVIFNSDLYVRGITGVSASSTGKFKGGIKHSGFNSETELYYEITSDYVLVYC